VIVWDLESEGKVWNWLNPRGVVQAVACAPDSRHLALATADGSIHIVRLAR